MYWARHILASTITGFASCNLPTNVHKAGPLGKAHPGLYHDVIFTSEMDHHGHFVALTKIIIPDIYPKRSVQLIYIK
jgi:hypothetical protein